VNPRYLLDTNILSEPMRPRPKPKALNRIQQYEGRLAIAAPVLHELLFGCLRLPISKRRDALEAYLTDTILPVFPILPYDAKAAQWHAAE
jgi:tRNA(fMet)-specific endonuclease VapC